MQEKQMNLAQSKSAAASPQPRRYHVGGAFLRRVRKAELCTQYQFNECITTSQKCFSKHNCSHCDAINRQSFTTGEIHPHPAAFCFRPDVQKIALLTMPIDCMEVIKELLFTEREVDISAHLPKQEEKIWSDLKNILSSLSQLDSKHGIYEKDAFHATEIVTNFVKNWYGDPTLSTLLKKYRSPEFHLITMKQLIDSKLDTVYQSELKSLQANLSPLSFFCLGILYNQLACILHKYESGYGWRGNNSHIIDLVNLSSLCLDYTRLKISGRRQASEDLATFEKRMEEINNHLNDTVEIQSFRSLISYNQWILFTQNFSKLPSTYNVIQRIGNHEILLQCIKQLMTDQQSTINKLISRGNGLNNVVFKTLLEKTPNLEAIIQSSLKNLEVLCCPLDAEDFPVLKAHVNFKQKGWQNIQQLLSSESVGEEEIWSSLDSCLFRFSELDNEPQIKFSELQYFDHLLKQFITKWCGSDLYLLNLKFFDYSRTTPWVNDASHVCSQEEFQSLQAKSPSPSALFVLGVMYNQFAYLNYKAGYLPSIYAIHAINMASLCLDKVRLRPSREPREGEDFNTLEKRMEEINDHINGTFEMQSLRALVSYNQCLLHTQGFADLTRQYNPSKRIEEYSRLYKNIITLLEEQKLTLHHLLATVQKACALEETSFSLELKTLSDAYSIINLLLKSDMLPKLARVVQTSLDAFMQLNLLKSKTLCLSGPQPQALSLSSAPTLFLSPSEEQADLILQEKMTIFKMIVQNSQKFRPYVEDIPALKAHVDFTQEGWRMVKNLFLSSEQEKEVWSYFDEKLPYFILDIKQPGPDQLIRFSNIIKEFIQKWCPASLLENTLRKPVHPSAEEELMTHWMNSSLDLFYQAELQALQENDTSPSILFVLGILYNQFAYLNHKAGYSPAIHEINMAVLCFNQIKVTPLEKSSEGEDVHAFKKRMEKSNNALNDTYEMQALQGLVRYNQSLLYTQKFAESNQYNTKLREELHTKIHRHIEQLKLSEHLMWRKWSQSLPRDAAGLILSPPSPETIRLEQLCKTICLPLLSPKHESLLLKLEKVLLTTLQSYKMERALTKPKDELPLFMMSTDQLVNFLKSKGPLVTTYALKFEEHRIDGDQFSRMTDSDLKNIGVTSSLARKLMLTHRNKLKPTSLLEQAIPVLPPIAESSSGFFSDAVGIPEVDALSSVLPQNKC